MPLTSWKESLADKIPELLAREIDVFEQQIQLRKEDKIPEKVFAETRLRRGVYGQRYDNGRRNDGVESRTLNYPCGELTKGPSTVWDAPGMMRIKIPYGAMTAAQLEELADISEEYSDGINHITTRQDIQLHFIHIEDTPDIMRRLASVGITTREACGNVVRNVTACPTAGVCGGEPFDVSPYAHALTYFLLGHQDLQDFGRKVKVAFSGCSEQACGLVSFHDLGFIAKTRTENGDTTRGFEFYVGGGLGAVPSQAHLLEDFIPQSELFPLSLAVCRVFARLGEKENRARARMKFLVNSLGLEEFRALVQKEREILPEDPRWDYQEELADFQDGPLKPPSPLSQNESLSEEFMAWRAQNTAPQRQPGYTSATIACPLGDLTAQQMRAIADVLREFTGDTLRASVEQNFVLRWISDADLPRIFERLEEVGLAEANAGTIVDITACPGTDTCKLGHASSRGLAAELRERLGAINATLDEAIKGLTIKVSGCFNSCGQHHVSDIGFYGVGRKVKGHMVPHFQVVVGGEFANNGGSYGLAIGAIPSKNIPMVISELTDYFIESRDPGETFRHFVERSGKVAIKTRIKALQKIPTYEEDPTYYSDWGDPREFTTGDMGEGECAGAVVTLTEFGLSESERLAFEAQTHLENGEHQDATRVAFLSMITAARALIKMQNIDISDSHQDVVDEFRSRFYDTQIFFDPFAGGKFAHYFFRQHSEGPVELSRPLIHNRIEEALLFIEAAYSCYARTSAPDAA